MTHVMTFFKRYSINKIDNCWRHYNNSIEAPGKLFDIKIMENLGHYERKLFCLSFGIYIKSIKDY